MFFLNLTATEFFVLLGALGTLVTVLYLLDRVKRKKIVSSLRFWTSFPGSHDQRSRRRLQDPWSLVLQLIGLLLLLLALGQLQWGTRALPARDHVLIVDSSAWSGQKTGHGTLLDHEKQAASAWLSSIAPADRVMLVRADERAAPLVPFTSDHKAIQSALRSITPSGSALNLATALGFAAQARNAPFANRESVVYIGPGMIHDKTGPVASLEDLRVIPVDPDLNNVGIRGVSIVEGREPGVWNASIQIANYGAAPARRTFSLRFGKTAFSPRNIGLSPFEERSVEFAFRTEFAGSLSIELSPGDSLSADDGAQVWLPKPREVKVVVYTRRPEFIAPLFPAQGRVSVSFKDPASYMAPEGDDILVFDECAPTANPGVGSLWIEPPAAHSPAPVKEVLSQVFVTSWRDNGRSAINLRSKDFRLASAEAFETFPGDVAIAEAGSNPVVIERPATRERPKIAVIGFDPLADELRFQVTTPLLIADVLSWVAPEAFHSVSAVASHAGLFTSEVDSGGEGQPLRVTDEEGRAVPFSVYHVYQAKAAGAASKVEVFASHSEQLRISDGHNEQYVSLTLPDVAQNKWTPDPRARIGLPSRFSALPPAYDLWKLLALLGGAVLACEWLLYGRSSTKTRMSPRAANAPAARQESRELALK